jgi:hypothetical protein
MVNAGSEYELQIMGVGRGAWVVVELGLLVHVCESRSVYGCGHGRWFGHGSESMC